MRAYPLEYPYGYSRDICPYFFFLVSCTTEATAHGAAATIEHIQ